MFWAMYQCISNVHRWNDWSKVIYLQVHGFSVHAQSSYILKFTVDFCNKSLSLRKISYFVFTHTHTNTHTHTHTHTHHTHIYIYIHMCVCEKIYIYINIYKYKYIYFLHIYIYILNTEIDGYIDRQTDR